MLGKNTCECRIKDVPAPCLLVVMLAALLSLLMQRFVSPAQYMVESGISYDGGFPQVLNCNTVSKINLGG